MSKHYLLVGASSGIGLELARKLTEEGHQVTGVSRTQGELPGDVDFHACDVTAWDQDLPVLEASIDGLVYFPGSINLKPFKQLSLDDYRKDWDVNYLGAVRVIQHFLKNLKSDPNSSVVLMSSIAATTGLPFHASIASAKAAIEGLTYALAAELAPKVRVNAVAPSLTDTPLAQQLLKSDTQRENAAKRHPLQAVGDPKTLASAVRYLLSDDAQWTTGQVLHVDGGLSTLKL